VSDSSPRGCRLSYEGRVWYDNTEVMQVGAWIVKREVIRQTDVDSNMGGRFGCPPNTIMVLRGAPAQNGERWKRFGCLWVSFWLYKPVETPPTIAGTEKK